MESFSRGTRTPGRSRAARRTAGTSPGPAPGSPARGSPALASPDSGPARSQPARPPCGALRGLVLIMLDRPRASLLARVSSARPAGPPQRRGAARRGEAGLQDQARRLMCVCVPRHPSGDFPPERLCRGLFLSSTRWDSLPPPPPPPLIMTLCKKAPTLRHQP